MARSDPAPKSETIGIEDLNSGFLSLRIGEEIPKLEIKSIRKLTNSGRADSLPGTDYKYLIETRDGKVLTVNSWVLWKKLAGVLKEAGTIEATLQLKHLGREDYSITLLSKPRK
jgi:hypothetical protein